MSDSGLGFRVELFIFFGMCEVKSNFFLLNRPSHTSTSAAPLGPVTGTASDVQGDPLHEKRIQASAALRKYAPIPEPPPG
jgi:hypothetical protein